jgi:hypothetical protein
MDITDRAITVASKFRDLLTQEEVLLLAESIQREMKAAIQEDRRERVDGIEHRLEELLVECDALEGKLRMGEDEAPEEVTTYIGYRSWRRSLVDDLYQKRHEYRELKKTRHSIAQKMK